MSRFIRYAVLWILLWPSCLFRAIAQDTDKSSYNAGIVPSVQAYEMSRYGNVSPSLYTGAMSYSVPLYTYSDPDFSLPISLDYNYSGYRPSQHSGYVGLGWNLNCGGVITREIVGLPDDYDYNGLRGFYYLATSTAAANLRDSIANGSFVTTYEAFEHANYYCHSSPYVTDEQDASLYFGTTALYTDQPISNVSLYYGLNIGTLYDTSSDIYHFSIPGCSGSFVISITGEIIVFNSTSPEGEINVSANFTNGITGGSEITIETADGTRYFFGGGLCYSEWSEDILWGGTAHNPSRYLFSSLRLRRILAPDGRTADFIYNDGVTTVPFHDIQYVDHGRLIDGLDNVPSYIYSSNSKLHTSLQQVTSYLPLGIDICGNRIVTFNYDGISCGEFSSTAFSAAFHAAYTNFTSGPSNKRLSGISVKDNAGNIVDTITLEHSYTSSMSGYSPKMFLTSVTCNNGRHSFEYAHSSASDCYPSIDCDGTDHWGFWRNTRGTFTFSTSADVHSQDASLYNPILTAKEPDYDYTRYGALTAIHYPTGGSTEIEYAPNEVTKRVDVNINTDSSRHLDSLDEPYPAGGLRVSKIRNSASPAGSFVDSVSFEYAGGILYRMPRYIAQLSTALTDKQLEPVIRFDETYKYAINLCDKGLTYSRSGDHIGYSSVSKRYSDGSVETCGFCDYEEYPDCFLQESDECCYSKFFMTINNDGDIQSVHFMDLSPSGIDGSRNPLITEQILTDRSQFRGKPKEVTIRDATGNVVKRTGYHYSSVEKHTANALFNCFSHFVEGTQRYLTPRLDTVVVTDYLAGSPVSVTTTYAYNTKGQKISETTSSSACTDVYKRLYLYCHESDSDAPASNVAAVATTRVAGSGPEKVTSLTRFTYDSSKPTLPSTRKDYEIEVPYQSANAFTPQSGASYRQTSYTYNTLWRPSRIDLPGGAYVAYTWDTSGRYPVRSEENGPVNVTEYGWQDMVGLSHRYLPTHLHEYYHYDSRGRLHTISNGPTDSLVAYSYHLYSDDGAGEASYVRKRTFYYPSLVTTDIDWYDGLGYPVQSVAVGAGTGGGNVVTPHWLGPMRRTDAREYLPYLASSSAFNPTSIQAQETYYRNKYSSSETRNYTERRYGTSPAGRLESLRRPGMAFAGHPDTLSYRLNTASDNILELSHIRGSSRANTHINVSNGYLPAGRLKCTVATDADGQKTETFEDAFGHTVLSRRLDGDTRIDTYFVRDLKDSLVCVIQPEGSARLTGGDIISFDLDDDVAAEYSFLYQYDGRGNVIWIKQPGAQPCEYAYDDRGRVTFSRDGNLADAGRWIRYTYDSYDRLTAKSLVAGQTQQTPIATLEEYRYDDTGYTTGNPDVPSYLAFSPATNSVSGVADSAPTSRLTQSRFRKCYERFLVLPSGGSYTNPSYVERAFYYDNMGRILQTVEKNAQGGTTRDSWNYDWQGNVQSHQQSVTIGGATTTILTAMEYDSRVRLLCERTFLNGTTARNAAVSYGYDELGRQSFTSDDGLVQLNQYTLQGWMLRKNVAQNDNMIFWEILRYADPAYSGMPRYNGTLSEVAWNPEGGSPTTTYAFEYDGAGRLKNTARIYGGNVNNAYTERNLTYDRNGNILSLKRYGTSSSAPADNFSYTYAGNRLSQLNGSYYAYDDNGNMTADGRQGLEMEYNVLNLPRRIEDAQTGVGVSYSYLADGTKAEMRRDDGTGLAYAGDMVFTRGANGAYTFESAAYCNGRLLANGSTQKFVTDHLGSVRAVVTGGQVVERNDYYPLGMRHPNPSYAQLTANRYGYNGKERQDIASNGTYLDYGARFLDPVLGRWTTCDPMAEKYLNITPYNFCGNDPINYVDPDGQIFDILWDAANVVMDVQSMVSNIKGKDYLSAAVDAGGLVLDAAAALVPGVPGGVGTAMKTVRNGDCVTDVSKVVKKITPNYGKSKPHGKKPHDNFIDSMIKKFPKGSDDIRKNQKQVDYNGNTVGNNRPDWQYNYDGKHYCGEVDNVPANNRKHEMVIKRNDPESIFEGHILK